MEKKMENEMDTCVVGAKELGVSQERGTILGSQEQGL